MQSISCLPSAAADEMLASELVTEAVFKLAPDEMAAETSDETELAPSESSDCRQTH